MNYTVISADCHLDPEFLPKDTFTSRVPAKWKERMPRVVETDAGPIWMAGDTKLGAWGGRTIRTMLTEGRRGRRMMEDGFDPEQRRPGDPKLRQEDMRKDGVDAEVVYGAVRRWKYLAGFDSEPAAVMIGAYNEYLAEFAQSTPGRFFGLGGVPADDVQGMAKEIRHIAELGLSGVEVPLANASRRISDPYWEPLWQAASEHDIPLHIHIPSPTTQYTSGMLTRAVWLTTAPLQLDQCVASIIFSGMLERHTGLKIVLAESGIGWLPYLVDRLDYEWENSYEQWKGLCSVKPSELFKGHIYATFQEDNIGVKLAHLYPDNFLWGSDYPHFDGVWPDSQDIIRDSMGELPQDLRSKLTRDNAAKLYKIR